MIVGTNLTALGKKFIWCVWWQFGVWQLPVYENHLNAILLKKAVLLFMMCGKCNTHSTLYIKSSCKVNQLEYCTASTVTGEI